MPAIESYTLAEVAAMIRKSPKWLRAHAAGLPHSRIGQTYVWTDEDLADLKDAIRQRPAAQTNELRPVMRRRSA